jgi:hypothetical protein
VLGLRTTSVPLRWTRGARGMGLPSRTQESISASSAETSIQRVTHLRVAIAEQVVLGQDPAGTALADPGERLDYHGPVESHRILGPSYQDARDVGHAEHGLAGCSDGGSDSLQIKLLLDIARRCQVRILGSRPHGR